MLEDLPVSPDAQVLDIASGTGEFSRALAPHVGSVIGLDATDAMMEQGKKFIAQAGIENIHFKKGVVQEIPFEDESFDIVASRYAFHHFADPRPVISEMIRVCKTGGHIIIVDIIVPDQSTAVESNYYEWLCDQSHTRALHHEEFQSLFRLFGLELVSARTRVLENEFVEWMDFSLTEKEHREEILRAVDTELRGGSKTGLGPYEPGLGTLFQPTRSLDRGTQSCWQDNLVGGLFPSRQVQAGHFSVVEVRGFPYAHTLYLYLGLGSRNNE